MRLYLLITFLLAQHCAIAQKSKLELAVFSHNAGFYSTSFKLSLSCPIAGATIYYTLDGSEPNSKSIEYKNPISIDSTTVVRTRVYHKSYLPSPTSTATFFLNEKSEFAIVSLSLDPKDLWDEKTGIYVEGPNAKPKHPHYGANYWREWEKPGHVEFWDTNGVLGFSQDIGIRIFGGWSRTFPQKSFKLYAKEEYGEPYINYPVFPDKSIKKYKRIVLRNGGSDCDGSHFRDEFMIGMLKKTDIDMQAYRPAIVFLNGQYWGIYFIREKIDEYFIEENYGINKGDVIMVEKNNIPKCGTLKEYNTFLEYLKKHDLADSANFTHVKTLMDVENYARFSAAQIYFQNRDAGGNTRCWRSDEGDLKWRWIAYDVDLGYGRFNKEAYKEKSLDFCTNPNGPPWPNPPWSTFLLRKMFENNEFKIIFINQMCDYLNSNFYPDSALSRIDGFKNLLAPEMDRHLKRWSYTQQRWQNHMDIMKEFAIQRPFWLRKQMLEFFNLKDSIVITLQTNKGGKIQINSVIPESYPWKGIYFSNIPITLTAIPPLNYLFAGWEGIDYNTISVSTNFEISSTITAIFKPIPLSPYYDSLVFNEIGFDNKKNRSGDWVEIVNISSKEMDISGWMFKDGKDQNVFYLPDKLVLKPNQYIVLANDIEKFEKTYPNVINVIGNFSFGLHNYDESLRLFDKNGHFVDSLSYHLSQTDSIIAISLKDPSLTNSDMKNWVSIMQNASPGNINAVLLEKIRTEEANRRITQEKWKEYRLYAAIASVILLVIGILLYVNERRKRKVALK